MLEKMKTNYPKLTAKEIINQIAKGSIGGHWLRKSHYEKAKELCKTISEEDSIILLDKWDDDRQGDYNDWNRFN